MPEEAGHRGKLGDSSGPSPMPLGPPDHQAVSHGDRRAMNGTDVQNTLREMWDTRPARPRDDRQVAGVAAALARRYDIDPTLVRVGFVVAAFAGIGAALYIAGWFLLPEEPADPASPTRPRPPR